MQNFLILYIIMQKLSHFVHWKLGFPEPLKNVQLDLEHVCIHTHIHAFIYVY